MRRFYPWFLLATLILTGLWVGYTADSQRLSSALLLLEPALDLACVLLAYLFWTRRNVPLSLSFLLGVLANFAAVRLPWPAPPPADAPALLPPWIQEVQNCLPSVGWPQDGLRILQWTVDEGRSPSEIVEVVVALRPDIFLLSGLEERSLAVRLHTELGGEYQTLAADGDFGGRLIFVRETFHICGESSSWSQGTTQLALAGVTPETIVPLLAAWHQGPLDAADWSLQRDLWAEDLLLLQQLSSPATILATDASALPTWRYLQAGLQEVALRPVPSPPNWPIRLLNLPMLPLHPLDRLWVGQGWTVTASQRVKVRHGQRAPVLTTLEPTTHTAQNRSFNAPG